MKYLKVSIWFLLSLVAAVLLWMLADYSHFYPLFGLSLGQVLLTVCFIADELQPDENINFNK